MAGARRRRSSAARPRWTCSGSCIRATVEQGRIRASSRSSGPRASGRAGCRDEAARALEARGCSRRSRSMPALRRRPHLLAPRRDPEGGRRDPRQRRVGDGPRQGASPPGPALPRRRGDRRDEHPALVDRRRARLRPAAGAEPQTAQRMIARAWQRYVEALAADRPLVALIEDCTGRIRGCSTSSKRSRRERTARRSCCAWPDRSCSSDDRGGGRRGEHDRDRPLAALGRRRGDADRTPAGRSGAGRDRRPDPPPFRGQPVLRGRAPADDDRGRDDRSTRRSAGRSCGPLASALPDTVQGVIASRIDLLDRTRSARSRTRR